MYSEHPTEFPLEKLPVMIDPTLLVLAGLLFALVGLGGYVLGWRRGRGSATDRDGKHREAIYKAIAKAADAAMKASRHEVMARGEALHAEIQRKLGDALALSATAGAADALRLALDGRPAGDAAGHGGHGGGPAACGPVIFNAGKLVMAGAGEAEAAPHADGGHGEAPATLSHEETVAAVRRAVERFCDHWADKDARLEQLRRAQIQLAPPA